MGDKTGIEWTDATWNPIAGCSIVSPGCTNCYAMKMASRIERMGGTGAERYVGTVRTVNGKPVWTGKIAEAPTSTLIQPLRWARPRRIFVNSMSDLFHPSVTDAVIDRVFAVMALAPQHVFQVLTKRSWRMQAYCADPKSHERVTLAAAEIANRNDMRDSGHAKVRVMGLVCYPSGPWPLPNLWLGVSAEDQVRADERITDLLATPADVRFVSAEPLLGPIDFTKIAGSVNVLDRTLFGPPSNCSPIDWIIVGGESGPGARPMHPAWARGIRDQCATAGVAFLFKQHGDWIDEQMATAQHRAPGDSMFDAEGQPKGDRWHFYDLDDRIGGAAIKVGKKAAGRLLDGREHNDMPGRAE